MGSMKPFLVQTNSSFSRRFSASQGMSIKFANIPKQKFESQLTEHLFSDKAAFLDNQGARYLETVFFDNCYLIEV